MIPIASNRDGNHGGGGSAGGKRKRRFAVARRNTKKLGYSERGEWGRERREERKREIKKVNNFRAKSNATKNLRNRKHGDAEYDASNEMKAESRSTKTEETVSSAQ